MNPDQAEAGPSSPRIPTPPSTPPAEKTASRRRSWFGFVASPFASTSASQASGSPRRKSFAVEGEGEMGHELADRSAGAVKEPPMTPARRSSLQVVHDAKEEVLTIDGQVETPASVRRKRKGSSRGVDEEQGEVVRLEEIAPRRKGSLRTVLWPTEEHSKDQSDLPSPIPPSQPKVSLPKPPKPDLSIPIPSSPRSFSLSIPTIRVPPDKSTPLLPTERPLPALPSDSSPPPIPADIVITPSSPRKLHKPKSHSHTRRTSSSMTDLRAARHPNGDSDGRPHTSSGSRSSSRAVSRKSSMIGLGLPRSMSGQAVGEMLPPPVPHKTQSVSSPHPSRSSSPVPKISFAEPEEEKERGRTEKTDGEKKGKAKRARSLSGIFNRSASQPVPGKPASVVNDDAQADETLQVEQEQEHESGKMAGVLEWLGVRKAGKRRASDAKPAVERADPEKRESAEDEKDATLRADPFRRPDLRNISSSATVTPYGAGQPDRPLSSDQGGAPSAIDIPSRQSTSSLNLRNLPDSNVASPRQIDTPMSNVTSPGTETEEMFFSPPGAPWVDGSEAPRNAESGSSTPAAAAKDGRLRSWSDAPTRSPQITSSSGSPIINDSPEQTPQPPSSFTPRPKMGNRSHSGNSVLIEKMKGVFTKSSARNRSRSKSLLPPRNGEDGEAVNEFGGFASRDRPGTASSASLSSQRGRPALVTNASLLDLHGRRGTLTDTPHGSPQVGYTDTAHSTPPTSYAPSVSTTASGPIPATAKPVRTRGRASTVSFASSAPQSSFLPPPPPPISPSLFPTFTPPRRRPSAIQRFSSGLLGSSAPSSPKGGLFPLPPRTSTSTFSSGGAGEDASSITGATSLLLSPGASPRPSTGSGTGLGIRNRGYKVDINVEEGETAEGWLERMVASVGRDEIAGVLAVSGDELHARALELYMAEFDFTHSALDVALRRLLMQISLPKEAQQIDRVVEAFAKRYEACEPGLFGSTDNTYVLAFSMMMLHTDAFNRNNKNKMSKAEYVRNTRMEGVNPITLEAFYDNITYTPFVYFDVDADVPSGTHILGGRSRSGSDAITPIASPTPPSAFTVGSPVTPGSIPNGSTLTPSTASTLSATPRRATTPTTSSALTAKQPDVYALIAQNNLHPLRVDVERSIPAESPFSCIGTRPFLEMGRAQNAFVEAGIMRIGDSSAAGTRKRAGSVGRKKGESDTEGAVGVETEVSLRVTKVGTLSRKGKPCKLDVWLGATWWADVKSGCGGKEALSDVWGRECYLRSPEGSGGNSRGDEPLDSTRKVSRKWKSWSVILTGSQLLFFKDPFWALSLQEQMKADNASVKRDEKGHVLLPKVSRFIPDEVFPVKDAVAVLDRSLTGHPHTFRFHLPNRAYLIQASDEYEMNEWISLINYSAAFKTSGIRMRAGSMRKDQALLAGAAAASSLKRESVSLDAVGDEGPKGRKRFGSLTEDSPTPVIANGTSRAPPSILSVRHSGDSRRSKTPDRSDTSSPVSGKNARTSVESESPGSGLKDDGERLGEVFRAVKAELAAEPGLGLGLSVAGKARAGLRVRIPSSQAVRTTTIESTLDSHLTQARNLAILTPFQRTTRDRISSAVPPLAAKIRDERLIIAKLALWISILQCDLDREEREWEGTRRVALQGAKRSLKDDAGVRGVTSALEAGEIAKVRFEAEERVVGGEEGGEGQEVLADAPSDNHQNGDGVEGGPPGSATTQHELPVLFRLPSDEASPQMAGVSTSPRPGMRRHVSASLLRLGGRE